MLAHIIIFEKERMSADEESVIEQEVEVEEGDPNASSSVLTDPTNTDPAIADTLENPEDEDEVFYFLFFQFSKRERNMKWTIFHLFIVF